MLPAAAAGILLLLVLSTNGTLVRVAMHACIDHEVMMHCCSVPITKLVPMWTVVCSTWLIYAIYACMHAREDPRSMQY